MDLRESLNLIWSVATVLAQIASVFALILLVSKKARASMPDAVAFLRKKSILLALLAALLATLGSLVYSDVLGYEPCKLCWFQRIFMYPQVILLALAAWKKDSGMALYGAVLSAIGAAIALYHYIGQLGFSPLPCGVVGYSVSCAERFVMEFGYITIPMMAFAAFAFMFLVLLLRTRENI